MSSTEEPTAQDTAAPAAPAAPAADESVAQAQVDGSGATQNGDKIVETEYNVEVKLADMQADPNNPLFSAQTFEELQLYNSPPPPHPHTLTPLAPRICCRASAP
jgi:ATP-dependent RNA helicase DDX19/DBP5